MFYLNTHHIGPPYDTASLLHHSSISFCNRVYSLIFNTMTITKTNANQYNSGKTILRPQTAWEGETWKADIQELALEFLML